MEEIFTAEQLLKKRIRKGETQFLVKWKGYSSKHNSWEPDANILDPQLIYNFENRKHLLHVKAGQKRRRSSSSGSKKDLLEESDHLYKVFIPRKTFVYPPPLDEDVDENEEEDPDFLDHDNENTRDFLNIGCNSPFDFSSPKRQRLAHAQDDVMSRDLNNNGYPKAKLYPLPPKKRWVPRGFSINSNGATVWVTDVKCRQLTVTILESEDSYFDSKCF